MIDMLGNEVKVGDKVIYVSRSSKKLELGFLTKEIGPKKGIVDNNPDGLRRFIERFTGPGKYYHTEDEAYNSYVGNRTVISSQIFKVE